MKSLLIYYGWLNSFNSAQNSWSNDAVAADMSSYDMLVFGDGIQDPSHDDYSNTTYIINKIKTDSPNIEIFGYVTANQDLTAFQGKVDQWNTLGVHGIFIDEAGYDFGVDRAKQNSCVNYIKTKDCSKVFVNAWNIDHVLGTDNDTTYPNSTFNPGAVESDLERGDWFLAESFAVNTQSYTPDGVASVADWKSRGTTIREVCAERGINVAACGIIADDKTNGQDLFDISAISSEIFEFEAHGTSSENYGASSASVKKWIEFEEVRWPNWSMPGYTEETGDSDKVYREKKIGKLYVDFSPVAQAGAE